LAGGTAGAALTWLLRARWGRWLQLLRRRLHLTLLWRWGLQPLAGGRWWRLHLTLLLRRRRWLDLLLLLRWWRLLHLTWWWR
jgi:hypothetical protein